MSRRLVIFCGIPGSGKTTIARKVTESLQDSVHIQTDEIRAMVREKRYTKSESKFVYMAAISVAREALRRSYNVLLDGTFPREEYRGEALRKLAGLYETALVVHVSCDLTTAYQRNVDRREPVTEEAFLRLVRQFEEPQAALRVDSDKTKPELAAQAVLLQIRRS